MPILGDGGPVYTGPNLFPNPSELSCGDLVVATAVDFIVSIKNVGDSDLEIFDITSSDPQVTLPTWVAPQTLAPDAIYNLVVRVTPAGLGAGSAVLTTVSNAINNPVTVAVSWTGVAAGVIAITVNPTDWEFPNTKVGQSSAEKVFTIENTGTVNVTINAPTYPADFAAGATLPAYPVVVGAGNTLDFGVIFSPTGAGYFTENVQVNSTAAATPFLVNAKGEGFLIASAYNVNLGQQGFLFGFALEDDSFVREMDWSNFDTEVECRFQKLHNFGTIGEDRTVAFFGYHYEDHGECEIEITFRNQVTQAETVMIREIGTVAADQAVLLDFFELDPPLETENTLLKVRKLADDGILFIIDYFFKFKPFEEQLGTLANPKTITPAFPIIGEEVLLMGFQTVVRQLDSEDFECETDASVGNHLLLPFQVPEGSIPGFTYEKLVARVFFHYEDFGVAVITVRVTSMRGEISSQNVSIGSVGADKELNMGIADLVVKDEVVKVEFIKVSGVLMLVDYVVKYETGGERKK